jgi:hypothetical protein
VNELHDGLAHNTRRWYQVCAAMDSIGDTAAVLDSGVWRDPSRSFAFRYLRLYGLLQAVHAQQDSILFLWEHVARRKRRTAGSLAWRELRVLRNDLTAHSAKNAATVSRMSLRGTSPQILRWISDDTLPEFATIDFDQLVEDYIREASAELEELADHLSKLRGATWSS